MMRAASKDGLPTAEDLFFLAFFVLLANLTMGANALGWYRRAFALFVWTPNRKPLRSYTFVLSVGLLLLAAGAIIAGLASFSPLPLHALWTAEEFIALGLMAFAVALSAFAVSVYYSVRRAALAYDNVFKAAMRPALTRENVVFLAHTVVSLIAGGIPLFCYTLARSAGSSARLLATCGGAILVAFVALIAARSVGRTMFAERFLTYQRLSSPV